MQVTYEHLSNDQGTKFALTYPVFRRGERITVGIKGLEKVESLDNYRVKFKINLEEDEFVSTVQTNKTILTL